MVVDSCKLSNVRAVLHTTVFAKAFANRAGFPPGGHAYFHTLSSSSSDLPLVSGTKRHINQAASSAMAP